MNFPHSLKALTRVDWEFLLKRKWSSVNADEFFYLKNTLNFFWSTDIGFSVVRLPTHPLWNFSLCIGNKELQRGGSFSFYLQSTKFFVLVGNFKYFSDQLEKPESNFFSQFEVWGKRLSHIWNSHGCNNCFLCVLWHKADFIAVSFRRRVAGTLALWLLLHTFFDWEETVS